MKCDKCGKDLEDAVYTSDWRGEAWAEPQKPTCDVPGCHKATLIICDVCWRRVCKDHLHITVMAGVKTMTLCPSCTAWVQKRRTEVSGESLECGGDRICSLPQPCEDCSGARKPESCSYASDTMRCSAPASARCAECGLPVCNLHICSFTIEDKRFCWSCGDIEIDRQSEEPQAEQPQRFAVFVKVERLRAHLSERDGDVAARLEPLEYLAEVAQAVEVLQARVADLQEQGLTLALGGRMALFEKRGQQLRSDLTAQRGRFYTLDERLVALVARVAALEVKR